MSGMKINYIWQLFDSYAGTLIGPATAEQIAASLAIDGLGHILINPAGEVVDDGSWESQQTGVRKVYVA
jgi:hypothetical protein